MTHRIDRILRHHHPDFMYALQECMKLLNEPRALHPEETRVKALHRLLQYRSALVMFKVSCDMHTQALEMRRRAQEIIKRHDGELSGSSLMEVSHERH